MVDDVLSPILLQAMARDLSLIDLIHTSETFKQSGQHDSVVALYDAWVKSHQDHPLLYAALFNYSVVLSDAGKLAEAREALEHAIRVNPDFMPAHINLGRIYERQGSTGMAVAQWSVAVKKMAEVTGTTITHKTTALNQMARTLEAANQDEAAESMLRQSLEIDPHQKEVSQHFVALRQRQCEWPVVAPWDRVSHDTLMMGMSPLSAAAYADDPVFQMALSAHYNKTDVGDPAHIYTTWERATNHKGPLRIGYLSSDLREHAVGHLVAEVFGLHDRKAVEVFAYYCGPHSTDPMHENFKATADHWVSISGMDDATAAQRMVDDGIQILVDLNGYTREARHKLVALRPAPVIVNWLGYPGTMSSPYHHYIVADDWLIPPESEMYYTEKVVRIPCYQPNNRQRIVSPRVPTRKDVGLPAEGTVFCCFNGAHKITKFMFDRWLMILNGVPNSVLWLLGSTDAAQQRLRDHAASRGIDPTRLVFADKRSNPDHLARYALADLFLDTSPYGAHTTASDALWMGVPVLTMAGRSFASRVCGSLVRSAGIPELICDTATDYVERAITLGKDLSLVRPYHDRLVANRDTCVLFDSPLLVKQLERSYTRMWKDYKTGKLPCPDLSNLDTYMEVACKNRYEETDMETIADYKGWWQANLDKRHQIRPLPADGRLMAAKTKTEENTTEAA